MRMSGWVGTALAGLSFMMIGAVAHGAVVISGTYYEETASSGTCNGSVNCAVLFTAIPAGRVVLFKRLACSVRVSTSVQILRVEFGESRPGFQPSRFQDLKFADTGSTTAVQKLYVVESDPHFLVGPGVRPFLRVTTKSNALTNLDCHIAGEV